METPTLGSNEAERRVSEKVDPLIAQLVLGWMKFATHPEIQLNHGGCLQVKCQAGQVKKSWIMKLVKVRNGQNALTYNSLWKIIIHFSLTKIKEKNSQKPANAFSLPGF